MTGTEILRFYHTARYKLILSLSISLFFYLFLIFFLPFGVDNYNPFHQYTFEFLSEIFHFFAITLITALLNAFILRPLVLKEVTPARIVGWSIWTLVLLGTANFFTYNILGDWHDFTLISGLKFIGNCATIFVFPLVGTFFYFRHKALQQRIEHLLTQNEGQIDPGQLITFMGQGSNDEISLSVDRFLYARAQDNYVELYYKENNSLSRFLLRSSLGKLADSIDHPAISRCHRSYMVNLFHVKAVKGGRRDLELFLDLFDIAVPVSGSYRESVMETLKSQKQFD